MKNNSKEKKSKKIDGKSLHEYFLERNSLGDSWKDVSERSRANYEHIAKRIIEDLQSAAKEFIKKEIPDYMWEEWEGKAEFLEAFLNFLEKRK